MSIEGNVWLIKVCKKYVPELVNPGEKGANVLMYAQKDNENDLFKCQKKFSSARCFFFVL